MVFKWQFVLYICCVLLRFLLISSPGYIHPDEHFQNAQVMAQSILSLKPEFKPWEYSLPSPVRSILGPFLTTAPAFYALKKLSKIFSSNITSRSLLITSRIPFLAGSFVIDWSLWSSSNKPGIKWRSLLLWSTSWLSLVMIIRPFGNSLITILYSWMFCRSILVQEGRKTNYKKFLLSGVLLILGTFCHSTFLIFSIPLCLDQLVHILKFKRFTIMCNSLLAIIFGAMPAAITCVVADNIFYGKLNPSDIFSFDLKDMIITPLNFIRYNSNLDNLAQHGIHPWYLHCTINMLILFGPAYIVLILNVVRNKLYILLCIGIPLLVLSLKPHQEPRFLLPLAVPMFVGLGHRVKQFSKLLIGLWLLFNVLMVILFGVLHQGGVVPVMEKLSTLTSDDASFFIYKTYMPPRYLVANAKYPNLEMPDLVGMSSGEVSEIILSSASKNKYLVTTKSRLKELQLDNAQIRSIDSVQWHLDLDNLDSFDLNNLKDCLSLFIYKIE